MNNFEKLRLTQSLIQHTNDFSISGVRNKKLRDREFLKQKRERIKQVKLNIKNLFEIRKEKISNSAHLHKIIPELISITNEYYSDIDFYINRAKKSKTRNRKYSKIERVYRKKFKQKVRLSLLQLTDEKTIFIDYSLGFQMMREKLKQGVVVKEKKVKKTYPEMPEKFSEIMNLWCEKAVNHKPGSKIYYDSWTSLRDVLNGRFFTKISEFKTVNKKFTQDEIIESMNRFFLARNDPGMMPVNKSYIKKLSLDKFFYNPLSLYEREKSWFLHYLDNFPAPAVKIIDKNAELTELIHNYYCEFTDTVVGEGEFIVAASYAKQYYNSLVDLNDEVSIVDFVHIVFDILKSAFKDKLEPSVLKSKRVWETIVQPTYTKFYTR